MASLDTVWPADSFEFCPHQEYSNIAVCGTYHLDQAQSVASASADDQTARNPQYQKRRGKILLLELAEESEDVQSQILQEIVLPAVLDSKWCHREFTVPPVLAVADSEGGVKISEYQTAQKQLELMQAITCGQPHTLCLSIDWSNRRTPTTGLGSLVVSLSDGNICIYQPGNSELIQAQTWFAHEYEPWVAAWNYWDTNVVYSGGDDLKLKAWDLREGFTQPIFTNKRFDAGVTSIQNHPHIEHILAVGSYDNTVRLFDIRKPLKPLVQANVGGGAWRVKWHPSPTRKADLLVACMHDGAKVIHFNDDISSSSESGSWEVIRRFDEHKSMTYGVDWSFKSPGTNKGDTVIASCSFYDHVLYRWKG